MKTKTKHQGIQQLSIGYDAVEDRLLFKIGMANEHELSIWLTRRLSQHLLDLLNKTPLMSETDSSTTESLTEKDNQSLDFSTEYHSRKSAQVEQALLIQECHVLTNDKAQPMSLELLCTQKQSINFGLNNELLKALISMLQHGIHQANWNFLTTEARIIPSLSHSSYSLH